MHTTSQPVTAHHLHAQFVNQHQSLLSPHAHKGWGSMFSVGGHLSKDAKPLNRWTAPTAPASVHTADLSSHAKHRAGGPQLGGQAEFGGKPSW